MCHGPRFCQLGPAFGITVLLCFDCLWSSVTLSSPVLRPQSLCSPTVRERASLWRLLSHLVATVTVRSFSLSSWRVSMQLSDNHPVPLSLYLQIPMYISNAWISAFSSACLPSQPTTGQTFNNWTTISCQGLSAHHLPPRTGGTPITSWVVSDSVPKVLSYYLLSQVILATICCKLSSLGSRCWKELEMQNIYWGIIPMKGKGDKSGLCREPSDQDKDMTKSLPTQQELWSKDCLLTQSEVEWKRESLCTTALLCHWLGSKAARSDTGCSVKFALQINFLKYKYISCNIWDILALRNVHCISEMQI